MELKVIREDHRPELRNGWKISPLFKVTIVREEDGFYMSDGSDTSMKEAEERAWRAYESRG